MFYHLEGIVAEFGQNLVILDCMGIGFALNATVNTISHLHVGEKAKLYVAESIGESNFDLFGFADKSEKRCFEMLIGVSGVGPKAAQAILSANTPEALSLAVISGNEKALTVVPGIGKKIAQRVLLELKDKLAKEASGFGPESFSGNIAASGAVGSDKLSDAAAALGVLGYGNNEITAALKGLDIQNLSVEDIIRQALRKMAG